MPFLWNWVQFSKNAWPVKVKRKDQTISARDGRKYVYLICTQIITKYKIASKRLVWQNLNGDLSSWSDNKTIAYSHIDLSFTHVHMSSYVGHLRFMIAFIIFDLSSGSLYFILPIYEIAFFLSSRIEADYVTVRRIEGEICAMMYDAFEKDTPTTDDPLLWGDRNQIFLFAAPRLLEFAAEGDLVVNLLGFLSTETVQYVSVNRWITQSRGSSLRRVISETAPSLLSNTPLQHPSWVTAVIAVSVSPQAIRLMDGSNNPLLPGLGLRQQEAVIASNYEFIRVIVSNVKHSTVQTRR